MTTPNLQLPEVPDAIQGASDELRDGFLTLDAIVQLEVINRTTTTPPVAPIQGDRYIVPGAASGVWAPHANHVAYRSPTGWNYRIPRRGWRAWCRAESAILVWTGAAWQVHSRNSQTIRGTWVRAGAAIELPVTYIPHYFHTAKRVVGLSVLTAEGPGDCEIDIRKGAIGSYPSSSSMCGVSKPTISAGHTLVDADLSNWDSVEIAAGEFLLMLLDSAATFTYIGLQLELEEG